MKRKMIAGSLLLMAPVLAPVLPALDIREKVSYAPAKNVPSLVHEPMVFMVRVEPPDSNGLSHKFTMPIAPRDVSFRG